MNSPTEQNHGSIEVTGSFAIDFNGARILPTDFSGIIAQVRIAEFGPWKECKGKIDITSVFGFKVKV